MTVTYTSEVTTSRGFGCFIKLLARWRGSVYKIVWVDLLIFLGIYYSLNLIYHFILGPDDRETFKELVVYCDRHGSLIPISFILGFYVSIVMTRWWNQYTSIPFPDNLAILVGASIKNTDIRAKIIRRTIVRYVCVTFTITLTMISPKVKKRFPTLDHYIEAGLLTKDEKKIMEALDNEFPSYSKYWLPLAWAANIVTRGRHEGLIKSDESVRIILEEINLFRSKCGSMLDYDWISIPLVYTQVVTLAVYSYFIIAVIGKQNLDGIGLIDTYFPLLPVLEFFFYIGWLRVAETLINPYGEDDDDFEVVWMIDRNLQVVYLLVDRIHQEHPKLMRDQHWDESAPNFLPFTKASEGYMHEYPESSTLNLMVNTAGREMIMPEVTEIDGPTRRKTKGVALWRTVGDKVKKTSVKGVPMALKRVVTMTKDVSKDELDDVNEYVGIEASQPKTWDEVIDEESPFEKLRQKRREEHKQKVLKYAEMLKLSKTADPKEIIKDFIQI